MNRFLFFTLTSLVMVGCAQPNEYQEPPPPPVTVAKPLIQTVTDYLDETGTTRAVERVEIRARVSGFLDSVDFEEGKEVEAGQTLYQIQPQEYEATLAAAVADIAAKQAALDLASADLKREEELQAREATTEANIDLARAKRDAAKAALQSGGAARDQAQLDLDYTDVITPIAGRVERTLVKQGNLVGDGQATHLTTVIKYDPIHVYFSISENSLLQVMADSDRAADDTPDITRFKAFLQRGIDDGYPFEGNLDYADLGVDESTGTFTIRAVFPNPDMNLFPGLFVRIRIPLGTTENAVLIPERAVGADQAGRYVVIVGDKNVVERRNITVGAKYDDMVVVREGLSGDESVVIDGLLRARPGSTVDPKPAKVKTEAAPLDAAADTTSGDTTSGDTTSGDTTSGDTTSGDTTSGETDDDDTTSENNPG
jgi:RND family efflux transporter MFP subunit